MAYITNLPVNNIFNVTAYFGQQGSYWSNGHKGIDITGDRTLYSICDGEVKVVGWDANGWGRYVSIQPEGFPRIRFILCHLVKDSVKVKAGQKVSRTTVIGTMGTSGNSTGIHIHIEMRIDNEPTNPCEYLKIKNEKAVGLNAMDYKTTIEESNKILQAMLDKKDGIVANVIDYEKMYKLQEVENASLKSQIEGLKKTLEIANEKIKNAQNALK